jgi:hypothetical protein
LATPVRYEAVCFPVDIIQAGSVDVHKMVPRREAKSDASADVGDACGELSVHILAVEIATHIHRHLQARSAQ